jgi:hypothetical protein
MFSVIMCLFVSVSIPSAIIFSNRVVIEQKMVDPQGNEFVEKREFKIHQ